MGVPSSPMVIVGRGPVQPGGGSMEPGGYIPGGRSSEIPQRKQRPGGQNCEVKVSNLDEDLISYICQDTYPTGMRPEDWKWTNSICFFSMSVT